MRHRNVVKTLGRNPRNAMLRSLAASIILHEKMKTTVQSKSYSFSCGAFHYGRQSFYTCITSKIIEVLPRISCQ